MIASTRRLLATLPIFFLLLTAQAQPVIPGLKEPKPYKITNNGKQLTVKSSKYINTVMLWTTDGHRVVEHHDIKNSSFTFSVPVNNKIFFLMIGMDGGKVYTEKISMDRD